MRTGLTLTRLHGDENFTVTSGVEVPIDEQREALKEMQRVGREHPEIAEVQLWDSSVGITKKARFSEPDPVAEKATRRRRSPNP